MSADDDESIHPRPYLVAVAAEDDGAPADDRQHPTAAEVLMEQVREAQSIVELDRARMIRAMRRAHDSGRG